MSDPHMLPANLRSLPFANMVLAEYHITHWLATPLAGTPFERLLEPDYWAVRAREMHRGDIITIHDEIAGFYCELLVREVSHLHAAVVLLRKVELQRLSPSDGETVPTGHAVEFMGPAQLWAAKRGAQVLRSGFESKVAAMDWLIDGLGKAGGL